MKYKFWLALVCAFCMSAAGAVEVASLFTAQVPFDRTSPDGREEAYDTALAQVVLRVSGAELVNDLPLFDALFPEPSAYVVQWQPGPDDSLLVTFDGDAIEKTLRDAGQRVWGGDRPLTLVWVAVDWGQGEREILAAEKEIVDPDEGRTINPDRMLRERILDYAERRGLPVVLPLLDGEDRANVSFSDIWGGFDERVIAASGRYDVNSVLIGRVRADGSSPGRWTYYFGDRQHLVTGEPEAALGTVGEVLAAEFAISGDEPVRQVDLSVSGITSVAAYGELYAMLADINVIDSFSIREVAGDRISLDVRAHGGADRLARALRFEGLIEQDRIDMGRFGSDQPDVPLEFFYGE